MQYLAHSRYSISVCGKNEIFKLNILEGLVSFDLLHKNKLLS